MSVINWVQIGCVAILIVTVIAVFTVAVRSDKPMRRLFASGMQGLGAIALVNVTTGLTGVSLGFSWLTAGCGALLGVPGVIGLVLMQIILPMK